MTQIPVIVSCGHIGDLINILPCAYWLSKVYSQKINVVSFARYNDVLQACSYVQSHSLPGTPNLDDARAYCQRTFRQADHALYVTTPCLYGRRDKQRKRSFALEQWEQLGLARSWDDLPLILDQPSIYGRQRVAADLPLTKPYVVTCFAGEWSPFHPGTAVDLSVDLYNENLEVIDISNYRAPRIDDLIPLLEGAACLITIDTAILHLAYATRTPTIALLSDRRWPFSASHPRKFWKTWYKYNDVPNKVTEIVSIATSLCGCPTPSS